MGRPFARIPVSEIEVETALHQNGHAPKADHGSRTPLAATHATRGARLGIIIVTFAPDAQVLARIATLRQTGCPVCVVDNTVPPASLLRGLDDKGIQRIENGNRGGIAGAFNQGVAYLAAQGCTGYLTLDQDSDLPPGFIDTLETFLQAHPQAQLVCPDFIDRNANTRATFIRLKRFTYRRTQGPTTDFAISSGFYLSAAAWQRIGRFDERLVIDHVDTDYCLRARQADLTIHINRDALLAHSIGQRTRHRLLFVTLKPNHHSPLRRYYIARNGVFLACRHGARLPSFFLLNLLRLAHEGIGILCYERDKARKLKALLVGCVDGVRGRLGPCPHRF